MHTFKVYSSIVLVYSQICAASTTTNISPFSSPREETPHPLTCVSYTPRPISHPGQHQSTSHENGVTQRVPALQPLNSRGTLPCLVSQQHFLPRRRLVCASSLGGSDIAHVLFIADASSFALLKEVGSDQST